MSRRSLNEAFSLCQKAARGAGMDWGVAEECGHAAKWILRNRLPLFLLPRLLESRKSVSPPDPDSRPLRGAENEKALCPILSGALLSDEAELLVRQGGCRLDRTAWPILLAPFLADVGGGVELEWEGARVFLSAGKVLSTGDSDLLLTAEVDRVAIRFAGEAPKGANAPDYPDPDDALWGRLGRLAARTLVPSDEESRKRGAGAGLTDND